MEKLRNRLGKIKNFIGNHRRYTFVKETLTFKKESLLSRATVTLLFIIAVLGCISVVQHKQTLKHKDIASKHLAKIRLLEEEVSEKKYSEGEVELYTEIGMIVLEKNVGPCNKKTICEYIDYLAEMGIVWYPEVMKSICQIESGFGTSTVAKRYNNLFGMDHPLKRRTLSLYATGRFATFKNWKCSILDMALWDYATFKGHIPTKNEYYNKINTKYNTENPEYHKAIITAENSRKK